MSTYVAILLTDEDDWSYVELSNDDRISVLSVSTRVVMSLFKHGALVLIQCQYAGRMLTTPY